MRVVIATTQVPFVRGGAEVLAESLRDALLAAGHQAEIAAIPFKWYPPERILDTMLACRLLDLTESNGAPVDALIGIKFPAYLIAHPNKSLWLAHQHRTAYDLWGHPLADLHRYPNGAQVREAIEQADRKFIPEARAVGTISRNVSRRLERYCGIASRAVYPPPQHAERYTCADAGDYLFFPSRLNRTKRQELVIEAMARTQHPVAVRFVGVPDEPAYAGELRALAERLGVAERATWLGSVSEDEKIAQYAGALGVLFPPLDEDYGYIAPEAMLASKPLITCADSGGPLEFVAHGETGLVAEPTAESMAEAMDRLWENRAEAAAMGRAGRERYAAMNISWKSVIDFLLGQ